MNCNIDREHDALVRRRADVVVDIGSSSIKCTAKVIDDAQAATVATAKREWDLHSLRCEDINNAHEIVLNLINEVISQLEASVGSLTVQNIGFSSFGMNLVGIDPLADSLSCCELLTYASKNSREFFQFCEELGTNAINYKKFRDLSGVAYLHPSYGLSQILYTEKFRGSSKIQWMSLTYFIICRLIKVGLKVDCSVENAISSSEASWLGLLNFRSDPCEWIHETEIPEDAIQPSLVTSDLPSVRFPESACYATIPLSCAVRPLRETKLHLCLIDGAAAAIGSSLIPLSELGREISSNVSVKAIDSESTIYCCPQLTLSATIGTSAALRALVHFSKFGDSHIQDSSLFHYRINQRTYVLGGALTDGGCLISWWSSTIAGHESAVLLQEFERLAEAGKIGNYFKEREKHIPIILPFFTGERSPGMLK